MECNNCGWSGLLKETVAVHMSDIKWGCPKCSKIHFIDDDLVKPIPQGSIMSDENLQIALDHAVEIYNDLKATVENVHTYIDLIDTLVAAQKARAGMVIMANLPPEIKG